MFDFSNSLLAVLHDDLRVAQLARIDWRHGVLAGKSQVPDVPGSQRRSSAGDAYDFPLEHWTTRCGIPSK